MALQDDRYGQTGELQDAAQTPAIPAVKPLMPKSPVATAPLALPAGGGQATTQGAAPPPVADPLAFAPPTTPNTNPVVTGDFTTQPVNRTPPPTSDTFTTQSTAGAAPAPGAPPPVGPSDQPGKTFGSYADYTGTLGPNNVAGPPVDYLPYDHPLNRAARGEISWEEANKQNTAIGDPNQIKNLQSQFDSLVRANTNPQFQGNPEQDAAARTRALNAFQYQIQKQIDSGEVNPNDPRFLEFIKTLPTSDYSSGFTPAAQRQSEQQNTLFTNARTGEAQARNQATSNPLNAASGTLNVSNPGQLSLQQSEGGQRPLLPGGTASDAGGGSPNNPLSAAIGGPEATGGRGLGYSATNIDPSNALANQVITPGAGVDRYQQAKDALENYRKGTEGSYKADSDTIAANSFGAGRGVSGQNRTRQGDLALARASDLNTKGFGFLNDALTGSIGDAYNNIGIAQQQQGYQKGLSDTAFQQEKERALLEDQLVNSDFGRNLSRETAGYANSPEQWDALLSSNFGNQAGAAGAASTAALQGSGRGQNQGPTADDIYRLLDQQNRRPVQQGDETYDTGNRGEIP